MEIYELLCQFILRFVLLHDPQNPNLGGSTLKSNPSNYMQHCALQFVPIIKNPFFWRLCVYFITNNQNYSNR